VNFTREPIIETIISPREGCKLLVRSSKSGGQQAEEYYVDALEVVSFRRAFFLRSMERPKAFLVPASDYEVLEVKETRVALKNISHERQIKIGGGREASLRHQQRQVPVEKEDAEPIAAEEEHRPVQAEEAGLETAISSRMEKRRDRRRRRHRRSEEEWSERRTQEAQPTTQPEAEQKLPGGGAEDETKVSSSMFSSLIPPPPTLISQTLSRYKDKEFAEGAAPPAKEEIEEKQVKKSKKEEPSSEEETGSDSAPLHRIATATVNESVEASSFTSTNFSPLSPGRDPFFF